MREASAKSALVLAIGGGKGGIGKSVVAANLALAMARHGARVVLVDADLGSANLHTLFALDRPGPSLQSFLDGRIGSLQEVTSATGFRRVDIIRGNVAVPGAANVAHARKLKLLRHLGTLDADVVILDCGAGVHHNVVDFFAHADVRLVVSSPQLVSIQNAYGFLKATVYRMIKRIVTEAGGAVFVDDLGARPEMETLEQWIGTLERERPDLLPEVQRMCRNFNVSLLGNQLDSERELAVLRALSRMGADFLGIEASVLGGILRQSYINESVTFRKPFLPRFISSNESRLLLRVAEMYLMLDVRSLRARRDGDLASDATEPTDDELATVPAAPRHASFDRLSAMPMPMDGPERKSPSVETGVKQFRRTVAPPGASEGRRRSMAPL